MKFAHIPQRVVTLLVLALCTFTTAFADTSISATTSLSPQRTLNRAEVGGLVTGQTVTLGGRAFYDSFAAAWAEKDQDGRYGISISERPTARLGSQVFVDYGSKRMVQLFLPANRTLIPALGSQAAEQVFQAILDYQVSQVFGDRDLARDEF